jgi:hypothetical protein
MSQTGKGPHGRRAPKCGGGIHAANIEAVRITPLPRKPMPETTYAAIS